MIGTRGAAFAGVAVLGLAALLGPRAVDPSLALAAERMIRESASAAVIALDELRATLETGTDAARAGAAAVLGGDGPPSPRIDEAAALIAGSENAVAPARRAVALLASARAAWRPDAPRPPEPIAAGELTSIAAQLRASGRAADVFAGLRERAVNLPGLLERALRALDDGLLADAAELTSRARVDHEGIVAWETDLPTLPVWIDTTDAMISSVEQILDATRAGDIAAASEAADAFVALGDDAATADRALRIALSEGGSALTAAPLGRLAAALRAIDASRAAAAAILRQQGQ